MWLIAPMEIAGFELPRVVVLPALDDVDRTEMVEVLRVALEPQTVVTLGSIGSELPLNSWIAAVSLAIARSGPAFEGIHLVAFGEVADRLPTLSFGQKAARRIVHSYTCVDAIPTGQFVDWPDAPVTIIQTNQLALAEISNTSRLRGWDFVKTNSAVDAIVQSITQQNY
jgi:hypothetical protein